MQKPFHYDPGNILGEIPDLKNKRLLDVGAGLACSYCLSYIYHTDKDQKKIKTFGDLNEYVKAKNLNAIAFDKGFAKTTFKIMPEISVCGDARSLPFKDENFDIVTMGYLLDYFIKDKPGLEKVMEETSRVLKPKGYLAGHVLLHPSLIGEAARIIKSPFYLPKYIEQKKIYMEAMENNNLKPLKSNIRLYDDTDTTNFTLFFINQKV